jgi:restriction endonuclease S subunit
MAVRPISWNYRYIYYYLQMNEERYNENAVGLIPGITRDDILNSLVIIPPLPEQQKSN